MNVVAQLFAFLAALPELIRQIKSAVRMYRRSVAEGWAQEHKELGEAIENAQTDDDRRRLVRAATDLMRKSK